MRRSLALGLLLPLLGATCDRWEEPKPGLVISAPARVTSEQGGSATFQVSLVDAPTAEVALDVFSADTTEGAVVDPVTTLPGVGVTLRFGPLDWAVPQAVTVVGVDDDARDGDAAWSVLVSPASADARYGELDATWLTFTNLDDDTPGIRLSRTNVVTLESRRTTDTFTIALAARPLSTVTVPVVSGRPEEGRLRSSTAPMIADSRIELVFTPSDWSTPREVIVVAQADGIADGDQTYGITVGPATGDAEFAALPAQVVSAANRDTDGVRVACDGWSPEGGSSASISEGQTMTFGCVLQGRPTADVRIPFVSLDPGSVLLSTGGGAPASTLTLVFTPQDWSAVQFVTLHGVLDHVWEPFAAGPSRITSGPLVSDDEVYAFTPWSSYFDLYVADVDTAMPEGTAAQPLDLGGRLPWHGMVDSTSSYYRVPVAGDALLVVELGTAWNPITVWVDDDGDFSSGSVGLTVTSRAAFKVPAPVSGEVFLRVDGSSYGALFLVRLLPFQFATGLPVAIPDANVAGIDVPLTVSGGPTRLAAVTVTVKATHAFAYDLLFRLRSPAGTEISLVGGLYASIYSGGYPWTVFDDAAESWIFYASDANGEFRPEMALGSFAGQDANGVWTLHVVDASNLGWSGQLEGWGIAFR